MTVTFIGQWVQRRGTLAHLIESEITDRLVTRCGRQMKLVTPHGPLSIVSGDVEHCEQCTGRRVAD
jgi:hypothetical protein